MSKNVKNFFNSKTENNKSPQKRNFERKFVEQQAKKAFIKKNEDRPQAKNKLKLNKSFIFFSYLKII